MITRNLKNILAMGLQSAGNNFGCLRVTSVTGVARYTANNWNYPYSRSTTPTTDAKAAGISIGTGDTPATELDYQLESTITSGVSLTLSGTELGCDPPGNPWVLYKITVTNTGSDPLTIREVGYKQSVKVCEYPGAAAMSALAVCLIDRTVLDTPMTIQGGDAGVIYYKLSTKPAADKTVSGVEIVGWEWGTDAQIAAMIEAARLGVIDLQRDAGWSVGDIRMVEIAAFTGGGDAAHAAQTVPIVISSFEEYEGCGNVLQFDFYRPLAREGRINGEAPVDYRSSEMYSTTLPALVEALPGWLNGLLKTFSVKSTLNGDTIVSVPNNKLALRSEVELTGMNSGSAAGEGAQVELYKYPDNRDKGKTWWTRSVSINYPSYYLAFQGVGYGFTRVQPTGNQYIAPFGCI